MENKYIVNKGFSVKYDLQSLLLCFDYFNHGFTLPKQIDTIFTRKIFHKAARILIIVAYIFRLYELKYKIVTINDDAFAIYKGIGKWANTVKLVNKNGELKIVKKTFDKNTYLREKKFYDKYKNNPSIIQPANCAFLADNTIEIEFMKTKSFQKLIRDGSFDLNTSITHFNKIKKELKILYGEKETLIHSDLCPENIYIKNNKYYLIDFTDSRMNNLRYDLYCLLEGILYTSSGIILNKTTLADFSDKGINFKELLETPRDVILKIEEQFVNYKKKRFPERFNE